MGKKKFKMSKDYYFDYWNIRLTNLACNMFEWKNLPEEINYAAMEKTLMLGGYGIFFKDNVLDKYFMLPGAITGVDVYGYPTKAKPIAKNGRIRFKDYNVNKDCILIYCNKTRTTAQEFIFDYADKLADLDVAISMNTRAMKHPINVKANEQSQATVQTAFKQYDDDYYCIFSDKNLNLEDSLTVLNFGVSAKEILDLQKQKETVLNEFFAIFGISGTSEKRERMIAGEINAILQQVGINREMWLSTRLDACKRINKMFGLNLSVDSTQIDFETDVETDDKNQKIVKKTNNKKEDK